MDDPRTQPVEMREADVLLMARVGQGEHRAQDQLVQRLVSRVRRTAGALLDNSADADDASQLSLLELLRSAASYRGEASVEAWADRIAVRTTLRFARSRARRNSHLSTAREPDAMALRDDSGASLGDELPRPVEEYLQRLPEVRRTAIVLRHALGYSVDEVAELTGVSRNTVKDRLVHARREFRRLVRRDVLTARPLSVEDLRGTPELHDPSMPAPVRTT